MTMDKLNECNIQAKVDSAYSSVITIDALQPDFFAKLDAAVAAEQEKNSGAQRFGRDVEKERAKPEPSTITANAGPEARINRSGQDKGARRE
jgi:hypothetical protein